MIVDRRGFSGWGNRSQFLLSLGKRGTSNGPHLTSPAPAASSWRNFRGREFRTARIYRAIGWQSHRLEAKHILRIDRSKTVVPDSIAVLTMPDIRTAANDTPGKALAERIKAVGYRIAARAILPDDAEA